MKPLTSHGNIVSDPLLVVRTLVLWVCRVSGSKQTSCCTKFCYVLPILQSRIWFHNFAKVLQEGLIQRQWFSGKIQRCHRWAPCSIHGWRMASDFAKAG